MTIGSGIYQIINLVNGKCYVGSAVNIKKRCYYHLRSCRLNKHHSKKLQRAWNKGKKLPVEFGKSVSDALKGKPLSEKKKKQLENLRLSKIGKTYSPEHRRKISEGQRKRYDNKYQRN